MEETKQVLLHRIDLRSSMKSMVLNMDLQLMTNKKVMIISSTMRTESATLMKARNREMKSIH